MSPMQKIKKNRKKLVSFMVFFLMFFSVFLTVSFIEPNTGVVSGASISDFDNYIVLTIDHTQVPSDLSNFPVLVYNSSWVTGLNSTSFTFFQPDNSTECNWELEKYDSSSGELVAWVNVSSISSTTDTTFYLYYDSSNSSDGGENNPEGTWDSGYVAVYHMDDSSGGLTDSTNYSHDGTQVGTPTYQQTGIIGYAVDFDGTDDGFDIPSMLSTSDDITLEAWVKFDSYGGDDVDDKIIYLNGDIKHGLHYDISETNINVYLNDGAVKLANISLSPTDISSFHYFASRADMGSTLYAYNNGSQTDTRTIDTVLADTKPSNAIGFAHDSAQSQYLDGLIDEIRISNTLRSEAYLQTNYNMVVNKTTFITWGASSGTSNNVSLVLHGTTSADTVTHEGFAGDSNLLCNETGTHYEWIELNISVNTTPYPEFIQINVSDMPSVFTSANFSFQFTSDNSSWNKAGNWKTGGSGGWNFTINGSTWTTANGCYGSNPFTADGDSDGHDEIQTTTSIWIVEKCSIPASASAQTYVDTDVTKITGYVGYYT